MKNNNIDMIHGPLKLDEIETSSTIFKTAPAPPLRFPLASSVQFPSDFNSTETALKWPPEHTLIQ